MTDTINESLGGEVEAFIKKWKGVTIQCFGVCHKDRQMLDFKGYDHDGGLRDRTGKRWWVYFECPKCHYGHSFAKINFFMEHTLLEKKART